MTCMKGRKHVENGISALRVESLRERLVPPATQLDRLRLWRRRSDKPLIVLAFRDTQPFQA